MYRHRTRRGQRGQIVPITALAMIALIGGVALILEGGNAYAHQREAQNASDAVANAGATVLAQQLGGTAKTDADVDGSMTNVSTANYLNDYDGYYTNVTGNLLTPAGTTTTTFGAAARVGDGVIPSGAQGVQAVGTPDVHDDVRPGDRPAAVHRHRGRDLGRRRAFGWGLPAGRVPGEHRRLREERRPRHGRGQLVDQQPGRQRCRYQP